MGISVSESVEYATCKYGNITCMHPPKSITSYFIHLEHILTINKIFTASFRVCKFVLLFSF